MSEIVKRSDKVAFFGVKGEDGVTFHRMRGMTELSVSRNVKEYERQYVDEEFARTDAVSYATAITYGFDQHGGDAVHEEIARIHEDELIAKDAVRSIVVVDFTKPKGEDGTYAASMRDFSVIPDSEGTSQDAYTYAGTFKTAGNKKSGTATSTDGFLTVVFTEDEA